MDDVVRERWIACDLDNTLCLQGEALRREVRSRFSINVPSALLFDAYNGWQAFGVSRAQLDEVFRDGSVFRDVGVRPGGRAALRALREEGYKIAIVTDRFWYDAIEQDTRTWLDEQDVPYDELALVRAADKATWVANHTKRDIAVFFEDNLPTALQLAKVVSKVYLFDFPWNRTEGLAAGLPTNIIRTASWQRWRSQFAPLSAADTPKPFVIGVAGLPGSGKDTLHTLLADRGFKAYVYSDLLRVELAKRGVENPTRSQMQNLGDELRAEQGGQVLSNMLIDKIVADKVQRALVIGMRHPAEVQVFRESNDIDFVLVALEVSAQVRFKRMQERARTGDTLNWEDFLEADARDFGDGDLTSPKLQVGAVMDMADICLDNAHGQSDLGAQLDVLLDEYVGGHA